VTAGSLAENVRAELAAIAPSRRCDRLAEVSALFHTAGSLHLLGRGAIALHLDLAGSAIARRGFALLADLRVHAEIRTYTRHAFDRGTRYQLHVAGDDSALSILEEAGVLDAEHRPLDRPPGRVVARDCCRGAYLRGAFLGGGSLSGPRSPHLEVRTPTLAGASFVRSVASAQGVRLKIVRRASHTTAYAKGWEEIEGYLVASGAIDSARQLRARDELMSLPDRLREAADLRLRHPELSLRELALRASPPATKAGMQRRLARVVELAGE
jgi:DNA-binding protein WhiA